MSDSLRVAAAHRPPYVIYNGSASGSERFTGLLVDLLPALLQYANITTPYEIYNAPDNEGGTLDNDTWNGMVAELVNDRADLTLFPLTLTQPRTAVIDFTYSYVDGGIGLLVRAARPTATALGFLRPFSWEVWVCLLLTLLVVIVLMHILARLSPLGNYDIKAIRLASSRSGLPVEYTIDPGNSLWVSACWSMVNAPLLPRGRSWSLRILQLAFGFFCTVVVNTYTASLASLLTVQNLSQPISSLLDLLRADGPFVVNPNGSTYTYFLSTLDPVAQNLFPYIELLNNSDDGMHAVQAGKALAYLTDYSTLQYYQTTLNCKLQVAGDPFGPGNLALGLQKNSRLTGPLNQAMIALRSNGYVDVLRSQWLPADYCKSSISTGDVNSALEVREITGLFYLMFMIISFSFVWTGMERWAVWYGSRNPAHFKRIKSTVDRFWFAEQHHKNVTLSRKFSAVDVPASAASDRPSEPGSAAAAAAGGGARGRDMARSLSLDSVPEGSEGGGQERPPSLRRLLRHSASMPGSPLNPGPPLARQEGSPPKMRSAFADVSHEALPEELPEAGERYGPGGRGTRGRDALRKAMDNMRRSGSRRLLLWQGSRESGDLDRAGSAASGG